MLTILGRWPRLLHRAPSALVWSPAKAGFHFPFLSISPGLKAWAIFNCALTRTVSAEELIRLSPVGRAGSGCPVRLLLDLSVYAAAFLQKGGHRSVCLAGVCVPFDIVECRATVLVLGVDIGARVQ